MRKDIEKTKPAHDEEIELVGPLLSLEKAEDEQKRREKSIARLRLLWNERTFLARASAVGLVAAAAIAFLIPSRFTSTARLMPPDQGPGSGGMAMLSALAGKADSALGSLGGELLGLKTTGDLFIGILQSRTVEDDLIAKFDLRKEYGAKRWESARKALAGRTAVSQDRKSEIITIAVTDRSPQRAQQMAQEYVTELNKVVTNLNTSSAHRERVFLEGRLGQVQQDLESAEKNFSQFASKNTAIDIQEQGKAMIAAGATLEGQWIAAQTELEGLRQIFTDNNVRVRETQARVDELHRQLQKLGGSTSGASPAEQQQDSASLYPSIRELPLLGVSYADLYRRMKVQEAVFETLTQEYELAKVEEAKETPSVKVLDPADLPEQKSFPPRSLMTIFGALLAAMAGVAWVLGKAKWAGTISTDPGKAFVVEVFGDVRKSLSWAHSNGSGQASGRKQTDSALRGLDGNGTGSQQREHDQ
jgi:uncharacterized protein involved in exopolysaccharide biosynthesis